MKKIINPNSSVAVMLGDVLRRLPAAWLWPASRAIGRMLWLCSPRRRRDVQKAYRRLCEVAGIRRDPAELTKAFFERQVFLMTGAYVMRGRTPAQFDDLCVVDGIEPVRQLLRQGRGVLVVTLHFGTHLLSLLKLEYEGFPVVTVRPTSMAGIADPKRRAMLYIDRETVYVGEGHGLASPAREIVRKLRDGYAVGFAPDGDQGEAVMALRVCGGAYPIRRGIVEIIRLARCPVVYAQGMERDGKYYIWYGPVMEPPKNSDVTEFASEFLRYVEEQFTRIIREAPESIWWTRPMEVALGLRPAPAFEPAGGSAPAPLSSP
jgi:lauroyl/myristoyl acyltransferase